MQKDLGLYVHIPFCLQKCSYCDFLSYCADETQKELYTKALLSEIRSAGALARGRTLSTLYIGGGTPTCLGEENLIKIIAAIQDSFVIDGHAEFTVEANPETVTLKLMRSLAKNGVNRISLGVQAMDDKTLQKIGRVHNTLKVLESYAACRVAGFENINYDLIFALPDQSEQDFYAGLEALLKLEPNHLSLYSLQLEEGTPLYAAKDGFAFADEEQERRMYYTAREMLKKQGIYQYEISNFAKPGFASRHNTRYWDCGEYLGLGLGASSYFENVRYSNPETMDKYLQFCENFVPLYKNGTPLTESERQSEFFVLGLRKTKGIRIAAFQEQFGVPLNEKFGTIIEKYKKSGLLQSENGYLFFTERGMDVSNSVLCEFL